MKLYEVPNFNGGCSIQVWEWIGNFVQYFMMDILILSHGGFSKKGPRYQLQYVPQIMHTFLCFSVVSLPICSGFVYYSSSESLHWHDGNRPIVPVRMKGFWLIWNSQNTFYHDTTQKARNLCTFVSNKFTILIIQRSYDWNNIAMLES